MSESIHFKTLRLGRSGKVALVDAADYARLRHYSWSISRNRGREYVRRKLSFSSETVQLSHDVLKLQARVPVRFLNGDGLDCRRANLQPIYGSAVAVKGQLQKPFRVTVQVDGHQYQVGYFSTLDEAGQVKKIAGEVVADLRGRGLTRERIRKGIAAELLLRSRSRACHRWQLGLATGGQGDAGAELAEQIRAALPVTLAPGVREEAEQEIALAVLDGRITPDRLCEPAALRDYVRAAARLSRFAGSGRLLSLDHHLADGLRLIDVLAA